jgi:hypothetical protein
MGMIVKDCEVGRALPCLYGLVGMLAHTCVGIAALLRLLVQEQAKGKKEVFFLPFVLLRALQADLPERARHQSRSQGWM